MFELLQATYSSKAAWNTLTATARTVSGFLYHRVLAQDFNVVLLADEFNRHLRRADTRIIYEYYVRAIPRQKTPQNYIERGKSAYSRPVIQHLAGFFGESTHSIEPVLVLLTKEQLKELIEMSGGSPKLLKQWKI